MKQIFLLSGDYVDLAKEEILSLFDVKNFGLVGKLFLVELKNNSYLIKKLSKRLALTKSVRKLLFECRISDVEKSMKGFNWDSVYKGSFCLRIHNLNNNSGKNNGKNSKTTIKNNKKIRATSESKSAGSEPLGVFSEKNLAKYIWRSVKKPRVNLENPKTGIELFFYGDKAYCGLLVFENKEDFESRKSHLRPFPSPSSLHPKLARALVNITGIKENEILLDPFCGAGGFLIEAGLMGIKTIGYDIYKITAEGCKKNLDYYKIKGCKIKSRNALEIDDKFDCVVTDLPYGLNSNVLLRHEKGLWKQSRLNKKIQEKGFVKNLEAFYLEFLKNLRKKIKKKAVIIFPSYVNCRKLLKQAGFRLYAEFSSYVHRSLTRKIVKIG